MRWERILRLRHLILLSPLFAIGGATADPDSYVDVMRGKVNPLSHFGEKPTVESAIASGIMMAGTPDQVVKQVRKLYDHVGGFGHLLLMGQAGFLEHKETVLGIKTFARDVYPQLKEFHGAPFGVEQGRRAMRA